MAALEVTREDDALGIDGIPRTGETIGGKFVIESILGVGGMGVVVSARHVQLGQTVAIKFLRRSASRNEEAVNRFLREARASVGLQSAHVVRVMDVGTLDGGVPFMVMEHLTGTDLGQFLELRRSLAIEEAVDYVVQAMDAVAEAHLVGIVHRDLKPSNLFLSIRPDGSSLVKVLDFGISKAIDAGQSRTNLTSTTMVLGSPLYMSPEQVRSTRTVDTRTDVWALGVILYELIAGAPPFEAETVTGLCAKIVADPPVPLRLRRGGVPPALEATISRCLEKDLTQRHRSVAELALELRPFATDEGKRTVDRIVKLAVAAGTGLGPRSDPAGSRRVSVHGIEDGVTGYTETVASWPTTAPRRGRRVATLALVAGAVLGLFVVVVSRRSPRAASEVGAPGAPAQGADSSATGAAVPASIAPGFGAADRDRAIVVQTSNEPSKSLPGNAPPAVSPLRTGSPLIAAAPRPDVETLPAAREAYPPPPRPSRTTASPPHGAAARPTGSATPVASRVSNDDLLLDRK